MAGPVGIEQVTLTQWPKRQLVTGMFLLSCGTMLLEIVLTRIFSVTMWYHFAFLSVSLALLGMSIGAVAVYCLPRISQSDQYIRTVIKSAIIFSVTVVLSIALFLLSLQFLGKSYFQLHLVITCLIATVPFVFSGIAITLLLTKTGLNVGAMYSADLIGAAFAAPLAIVILRWVDGLTAIVIVALLAALAGFVLSTANDFRHRAVWTTTALVVLVLLVAGLSRYEPPVYSLPGLKVASFTGAVQYEQWNAYSRIRVAGDPNIPHIPFLSGYSPNRPAAPLTRELNIDIDSSARTVLTYFNGDFSTVDYLRYDVSNFANYLRPQSDVMVIGSGGGRDVLSALAFKQRSVVGVEMNTQILQLLNGRYGSFTGNLSKYPNVRFVNDEARSYLVRDTKQYGVIHVSFIDTWAATSAGGYALSENGLYTTDAWRLMFRRLTPNGVLTVTRWSIGTKPYEVYRTVALAAESLRLNGVNDPRSHVAVILAYADLQNQDLGGVATVLVSPTAFSDADTSTLRTTASDLGFDVRVDPGRSEDQTLAALLTPEQPIAEYTAIPYNIRPPTDDQPYFFMMTKIRDIFSPYLVRATVVGTDAMNLLGTLFVIVVVLALLGILLPFQALDRRRTDHRTAGYLVLYFVGIGLGYLTIELALFQRLSIFLGHPIYALSVLLFALLSASGIGSAMVGWRPSCSLLRRFLLLAVSLAFTGIMTLLVTPIFQGASTTVRILIAIATLFPAGYGMGMMFPTGMQLAQERHAYLMPWFWAVNGATSVVASVLAIIFSIGFGTTTTLWFGAASYVLAGFALMLFRSKATSALKEAPA